MSMEHEKLIEYFQTNLAKYITIKSYKKNELIFSEGDVETSLYIVLSGKVEVFKLTKSWEERTIFILSIGASLNEEILLAPLSECSTCCRAFENSSIFAIPKKIILKHMESNPMLLEYIFACTNMKLKRTYRQLKNSGTNITIDKKIASKLYKLALDYGIEKKGEILIEASITSTTLSKMVGAKRETVSRCMNALKKEGILTIEGDRITISDFTKLSNIFET